MITFNMRGIDLRKIKHCPSCGRRKGLYTILYLGQISIECDLCGFHIIGEKKPTQKQSGGNHEAM